KGNGYLLMIRHAKAPGFGDPNNIKIGDCSTQRNLNNEGRLQASKIGEVLKQNNIKASAIFSSQWCRCLETAKLLDMGEVKELSSLNSFFEKTQNKEPNLKALKSFINLQDTNKKLIIMVTHQVTISAISGEYVSSGDGVLLKLNDSKPYEFVGLFKN
ncbi:MAG: histidine phosphatase family protein, partial [Poseidonibacter sp.]